MPNLPVPRKWYSYEEFGKLVGKLEADQLALQGYVLQQDILSSTIRIIPWNEASGRREEAWEKRTLKTDAPIEVMERRVYTSNGPVPEFQKESLPKRRPVDRVDSLAARMMLHIQATGQLPGESDPRINEIVNEAWKAGRTEITGEVIRTVAANMLRKAEKIREVNQYKRTAKERTS
jgi:hypothetical protein